MPACPRVPGREGCPVLPGGQRHQRVISGAARCPGGSAGPAAYGYASCSAQAGTGSGHCPARSGGRCRRGGRGSPRPGINADGSGQIKGSGYSGGGFMSSTMVKIGPVLHRFLAVKLTDLQRGSQPGDGWVRLVPGLWHLAEATFLKTAIPLRPEARSRLLYRAGEAWPRALPLTRLTGTAIRSGPPCQHRRLWPGRLPCAG